MAISIRSILTSDHKISLAQNFISSHSTSGAQLYSFIGKTDQWEDTWKIAGITQASPPVVTSYFHGLTDGDIVTLTDVSGMVEINNALVPYIVANTAQHTFELKAIDTSAFTAYISGGTIHKSLEAAWPSPENTYDTIQNARSNIIASKRIAGNNMSLVVPRHNWATGEVYDFWNPYDKKLSAKRFSIVTDEFKVYKCLWNGNGAVSTIKPTSTSLSPFVSTDGYTWKYMYTITQADIDRFVSTNWIPAKTLVADDGTDQWDVQSSAVKGTINGFVIVEGGENYVAATTTISVAGDGQNASITVPANGVDVNGKLVDLKIVNAGINYSNATTITVTGAGNGAIVLPIISPSNGHGADPVTELLAFYVKIVSAFSGTENGDFMIDNDYRQIGLIEDPKLLNGAAATSFVYDNRTVLSVNVIQGAFVIDDNITGAQSNAKAIVTNVDAGTVKLTAVQGTFVSGEIINSTNGAQGSITSIVTSQFDVNSGRVNYIANFGRITRTDTQTEDFDLIIEF